MIIRRLLLSVFLVAAASVVPAQRDPAKPVRLIVPFPAGGPSDLVAKSPPVRSVKELMVLAKRVKVVKASGIKVDCMADAS